MRRVFLNAEPFLRILFRLTLGVALAFLILEGRRIRITLGVALAFLRVDAAMP